MDNRSQTITGGWVGKILEVDLSTGQIRTRPTSRYLPQGLGGRTLAAHIAWEEIPPGIDPFDPSNRIIVATGPLTGTLSPTSGRTFMSTLSPRIYPRPWYTHSTLGGWFGPALKYAGFDAIIIHGKAAEPVYLHIREGQAELRPAGELWGMDTRQAQLWLKQQFGSRTQVLVIGPAGERLVRFATVQHAEENAAGHSGFGAVWGSKNLKAITAYGTAGVPVADPQALWEEVRRLGTYRPSPNHSILYAGQLERKKPVCSQSCTFNCVVANFGQAEDGRTVPGLCVGGLAWISETEMKGTRYQGGGMEVPESQNFELRKEATLADRCNALGLDVWFRLVMQPWLIACQQHGIHALRGHPIDPNNPAWFEGFMHGLAYRQGLGALFADDLRRLMDELEGELPDDLIALGRELEFGFGFPAHREGRFWDEEPLPFWVISAMMHASESRDPTIGTHSASLLLADFLLLADRDLALRKFRTLSEKVWNDPEALEPTFENKAPLAIWNQDQHIVIDSLPLCDFAFPQVMRPIGSLEEWQQAEDISGDLDYDLRLLKAVTGLVLSRQELTHYARRAFTLERLMLARAGRARPMEEGLAPHFKLPCRADGTLIEPEGFSHLLDEYYIARGWDLELGWPKPETLQELGLAEAIPELERLREKERKP